MERSKVKAFLKNNVFYFVLGFCIVAIGIALTLVFSLTSGNEYIGTNGGVHQEIENNGGNVGESDNTITDIENTPTTSPIIEFILPVDSENIIKNYTETVVFNQTLNRYEQHKGIDFATSEGANVYAVYDGVVKSVTTSITTGVTIVIDHGNGLLTSYNSLLDGNSVWEGKSVLQGDVIGVASTSNRLEYKDGAHLHFEVMKDGVNINPESYLSLEDNK